MGITDWLRKGAKKLAPENVADTGQAGNEPEDLSSQVEWEKPTFRTREEYKQWLSQQGRGTRIKENVGTWWARRKARIAGDLPEEPEEEKVPGFFETLRGRQRGAPAAGANMNSSAVPKPTGRGIGLIIGAIVIIFVLLFTAAGTYVSGAVEKTGVGVQPAIKVGENVIKQGLGIIDKGPAAEIGGAESTEETKKEDRGIKITGLKPRRTEYVSPSVIEIEGYITAIGSGERQLAVGIAAEAKPDAWSILGVTSGPALSCQIKGTQPGRKIKARDLVERYFVCSSCEAPPCVCDGQNPDPDHCFVAKTIVGKEKVGAIKQIGVDVTASMFGAETLSTRTIYFTSDEALASLNAAGKKPEAEFGITDRKAKQEGDDTIKVELGILGNPAAITVADPALALVSGYRLIARAENPVTSTGEATLVSLFLAIESPARVTNSEDYIEVPASDVPQQFSGRLDPGAFKFYKIAATKILKGSDYADYGMTIEVPKDALGNGRYGTFMAKAYVLYNYDTPKSTSVTIRTVD